MLLGKAAKIDSRVTPDRGIVSGGMVLSHVVCVKAIEKFVAAIPGPSRLCAWSGLLTLEVVRNAPRCKTSVATSIPRYNPRTRANMALVPGTRLGAHEIVSLLGSGGMGEIYRAKDIKLGRHIALIKGECCSRTRDESLDATLKARDKKRRPHEEMPILRRRDSGCRHRLQALRPRSGSHSRGEIVDNTSCKEVWSSADCRVRSHRPVCAPRHREGRPTTR
jgi:hypothetical protein